LHQNKKGGFNSLPEDVKRDLKLTFTRESCENKTFHECQKMLSEKTKETLKLYPSFQVMEYIRRKRQNLKVKRPTATPMTTATVTPMTPVTATPMTTVTATPTITTTVTATPTTTATETPMITTLMNPFSTPVSKKQRTNFITSPAS